MNWFEAFGVYCFKRVRNAVSMKPQLQIINDDLKELTVKIATEVVWSKASPKLS